MYIQKNPVLTLFKEGTDTTGPARTDVMEAMSTDHATSVVGCCLFRKANSKQGHPGARLDSMEEMTDLPQIPSFISSTRFAKTRAVAQLFISGLSLARQPNTSKMR